MKNKLRTFLACYVTRKIGVEIKCCLMFFMVLCYYCLYRWIAGFTDAGILHMLQMVLLAYVLCWVQALLHFDFDEVDVLRGKELALILASVTIYTLAAYAGNWLDRKIGVCLGFAAYMGCTYLCIFLMYKIKRVIDAKYLNMELKRFQKRKILED